MNDVVNLITNLGFPIVCVIACAYFINYIIKAEREENQKREEKYIDTINNFSVVLDKVNDNLTTNNKRLEYIENKFKNEGYKLPKLIFWNVNSRSTTIPVIKNDLGVILVSGFSPAVVKMVLTNELDPYKALLSILLSERYKQISLNKE